MGTVSMDAVAQRVARRVVTAGDIQVHNVEFSSGQEPENPHEFATLMLVDFTVRGRTLATLLGKQMRVLERFLETAPKRKLLNAIPTRLRGLCRVRESGTTCRTTVRRG